MVELAVVEAAPVGLFQVQDGDLVLGREGLHVTAEPVADLLQQRGRGNREAQVRRQEGHHLTTHLEIGHVGIQVEPVDAGKVEAHMTVQHVVDVHHTGHPHSVRA